MRRCVAEHRELNGEQLTSISLVVFEFVKSNWPLIRAGLVVLAVLGMGSKLRWNVFQTAVVFLPCHDLARQAVEWGMTEAINLLFEKHRLNRIA